MHKPTLFYQLQIKIKAFKSKRTIKKKYSKSQAKEPNQTHLLPKFKSYSLQENYENKNIHFQYFHKTQIS